MKGNPSLPKIEKLFNVAHALVDEVDKTIKIDKPKEIIPIGLSEINEISQTEEISDLFTLEELKVDFFSAKKTLKNIINIGEELMDSVNPDFDALKASQVDALAKLSKTIGDQTKLMFEMYQEIKSLENKSILETITPDQTNIQNNVISVSSMDLLEKILDN